MNFPDIGINSNDGRKLPFEIPRAVLSGRYGPVASRFRFYLAPFTFAVADFGFISKYTDISEYVTDFSCSFDADTCQRSGSITFDIRMLGAFPRIQNVVNMNLFHIINRCAIFVAHEILIFGQWFRWPVGYFAGQNLQTTQRGGRPTSVLSSPEYNTDRNIFSYQLNDITSFFDNHLTGTTYTVPAGTEYVDAVKDAMQTSEFYFLYTPDDLSIKMKQFAIPRSGLVTPTELSWQPQTPWATIINSLLSSINYYPIWSTADGYITSGPKIRPVLLSCEGWWGPAEIPWQDTRQVGDIEDYPVLALHYSNVVGDITIQMMQEGLWNQVICSTNGATSTTKVSQIKDSAGNSYISRYPLALGKWITKKVTVDSPPNDDMLTTIADWECYYADFHSLQATVQQPVEFFNDRVTSPYVNTVFLPGNNSNNLEANMWADLGYRVSMKNSVMEKRYGGAQTPYYVLLLHPADPE